MRWGIWDMGYVICFSVSVSVLNVQHDIGMGFHVHVSHGYSYMHGHINVHIKIHCEIVYQYIQYFMGLWLWRWYCRTYVDVDVMWCDVMCCDVGMWLHLVWCDVLHARHVAAHLCPSFPSMSMWCWCDVVAVVGSRGVHEFHYPAPKSVADRHATANALWDLMWEYPVQ